MKKQRICIVGDGLSGLMGAIALNNLPNIEVHLISKKKIILFSHYSIKKYRLKHLLRYEN